MKISLSAQDDVLQLTCQPDPDDVEFYSTRKGKLARDVARFNLPAGFDVASTHPDILALLALVVFGPFAHRKMQMSWGVSRHFEDTVARFLKREISPVDSTIEPRRTPAAARPALAFSGGVDSYAAVALLPESVVPIFCHRTVPEGLPRGMYCADAALAACKILSVTHTLSILDTDMEFTRAPTGFSVDWTNAAGAILLADYHGLDSVSFGMIMESAYFIGHPHYSDLKSRSIYSAWAPIFEAVALPISLPTAGLSEVVTSKIVATMQDVWNPESCVRGKVGEPCMNCFKCFRKKILDARLSGAELPAEHFDIALRSKEVKRRLLEIPVHHEDVLSFSLFGLKCGHHPVLDALREKTQPTYEYAGGLGLLEDHYSKSLELVPKMLREGVAEKIARYAAPYSAADTELIEHWDIEPLTRTEQYQRSQEKLALLLT